MQPVPFCKSQSVVTCRGRGERPLSGHCAVLPAQVHVALAPSRALASPSSDCDTTAPAHSQPGRVLGQPHCRDSDPRETMNEDSSLWREREKLALGKQLCGKLLADILGSCSPSLLITVSQPDCRGATWDCAEHTQPPERSPKLRHLTAKQVHPATSAPRGEKAQNL